MHLMGAAATLRLQNPMVSAHVDCRPLAPFEQLLSLKVICLEEDVQIMQQQLSELLDALHGQHGVDDGLITVSRPGTDNRVVLMPRHRPAWRRVLHSRPLLQLYDW